MNRTFVLAACILFMSTTVSAQDDIAEYRPWMQSIRDTAASLGANLESQAGDAAAADANKLAEVFALVYGFWQEKSVADAMEFAMNAQNGFKQVAEHASAGRFDEASQALAAARENCGGCHQVHRERAPDGSWRIK